MPMDYFLSIPLSQVNMGALYQKISNNDRLIDCRNYYLVVYHGKVCCIGNIGIIVLLPQGFGVRNGRTFVYTSWKRLGDFTNEVLAIPLEIFFSFSARCKPSTASAV